jgi:hypothetical protein
MTSLTTSSQQDFIISPLQQSSKKRLHNKQPSNSIDKKTHLLWDDQENLILVQILSTSYSNESMFSMRAPNKQKVLDSKWKVLTNEFNEKSDSNRTERQVYKKKRSTLIQDDYFQTPFKELLPQSKLKQLHNDTSSDLIHCSTQENTTDNSTNTETYTKPQHSTSSQVTSPPLNEPKDIQVTLPSSFPPFTASSTSLSPKERQMQYLSHCCFVHFLKGYEQGRERYIKEKEELLKADFTGLNNLSFNQLGIDEQALYLGHACITKRLTDANTKNLDLDFLYPNNFDDCFSTDLFCTAKAEKNALARRKHEIQINKTKGKNNDFSTLKLSTRNYY